MSVARTTGLRWCLLVPVLLATLACLRPQAAAAPPGGSGARVLVSGPQRDVGTLPSGTLPSDVLSEAAGLYLPLAESLSPLSGYPRSITDGVSWTQTTPDKWTSGFFAGILWQLYEVSGDEALLLQAQRWTEGLEGQVSHPSHDVGFMIGNSFGRGYRATGDQWYRDVTLAAAEHLATRFDPDVGAIRSWGEMRRFSYPVIIDNMMNLEILFWAALNGGDESLAEVARTHAMTTIRDHVREDGTTFHVVDYDQETGDVIWRGTVQGLADTSAWARGQAWGLYGFTTAYRETGEPLFLETACRLADAFLERLPDDVIPCWDFDAASMPGEPKDASAAAIAASGLWELSTLVGDVVLSARYGEASVALLERLSSDDYSALLLGLPALLLHGTGNRPRYSEVDVPLIYAEYYYVEALARQVGAWESSERATRIRNCPNPFSDGTQILYELPAPTGARIRVYNQSGRLVRTLPGSDTHVPGMNAVLWDGRDGSGRALASGIYFALLEAGEETAVHKLVLLR